MSIGLICLRNLIVIVFLLLFIIAVMMWRISFENVEYEKATFRLCLAAVFLLTGIFLSANLTFFSEKIEKKENIATITYIEKYEDSSYEYHEELNSIEYEDGNGVLQEDFDIIVVASAQNEDLEKDKGLYRANVTYKGKWLWFEVEQEREKKVMVLEN